MTDDLKSVTRRAYCPVFRQNVWTGEIYGIYILDSLGKLGRSGHMGGHL